MTTEPTEAVAPDAGNALLRVVKVLWRPGETFAALAARPTWGAALLVVILTSAIQVAAWVPKVDVAALVRDRMAASGQEVSAEQMEQAAGFMEQSRWPLFLGPVLVLQPLVLAGIALAFYLVFRVMGSEQGYRHSLAVTTHAFVALALGALLSVPLILSRDSITTEEVMGGGVLTSNLGFLASEEASASVRTLLQSLDFFALWTVVLLAIGYSRTTRLETPSVVISVVAMWGLWVLARVGVASVAG